MSFLKLSLEIREKIYHELLCPPDGILLKHMGEERRFRKEDEVEDSSENESDEEEEDDDDDDSESEPFCNVVAAAPLQTAILYTNRQISKEASRILYKHNRFTFHVSAREALSFLEDWYPHSAVLITALGFGRYSTAADDGDCADYWDPLCKFIGESMHINDLNICVPQDTNHRVDKSKKVKQGPNSEWFWWPAIRRLCELLSKGKIQKLRLGYSESYEKPKGKKSRTDSFYAVEYLRREMKGCHFVATWEDEFVGGVGGAILLTCPGDGNV